MREDYTKDDFVLPSYVGERVKFMGYAGTVKKEHVGKVGIVTDFTRRRNPIILTKGKKGERIIDAQSCAKSINEDGSWMRKSQRWPEDINISRHDIVKVTPQKDENPVLIRVKNAKGRAAWYQVQRIYCHWYQGEQYLGLVGFKWRPKLQVAEGGPKFVPLTDVITSGSVALNKAKSKAARAAATRTADRKKKKAKKAKQSGMVTITRKRMIKMRDKKGMSWANIAKEYGISVAAARRAYWQLTGNEDQQRAAR